MFNLSDEIVLTVILLSFFLLPYCIIIIINIVISRHVTFLLKTLRLLIIEHYAFRKVLRETASGARDAERVKLKLEISVEVRRVWSSKAFGFTDQDFWWSVFNAIRHEEKALHFLRNLFFRWDALIIEFVVYSS